MSTIKAYKGFDLDWKCRDYQYEVGKTYEHTGSVEACEGGFHACEYPLDAFGYYPPGESRYAEVTQAGELARHDGEDTKVASAKITIDAEIDIPQIVAAAVAWVLAQCEPADAKHAEGDQSAASSTGDWSVASSTGDRSAAASTGDWSAASSTGDQSGALSTGYRSAASSTGDQSAASSTGYQSAASSTGERSAAMSAGRYGRVRADKDGCALFLVHRDDGWNITHSWAGITGCDGIKAGVWYELGADGLPQEVQP